MSATGNTSVMPYGVCNVAFGASSATAWSVSDGTGAPAEKTTRSASRPANDDRIGGRHDVGERRRRRERQRRPDPSAGLVERRGGQFGRLGDIAVRQRGRDAERRTVERERSEGRHEPVVGCDRVRRSQCVTLRDELAMEIQHALRRAGRPRCEEHGGQIIARRLRRQLSRRSAPTSSATSSRRGPRRPAQRRRCGQRSFRADDPRRASRADRSTERRCSPSPRSAITVTPPARHTPYTAATRSTPGGVSMATRSPALHPPADELDGDSFDTLRQLGERDRIAGREIDECLALIVASGQDRRPHRILGRRLIRRGTGLADCVEPTCSRPSNRSSSHASTTPATSASAITRWFAFAKRCVVVFGNRAGEVGGEVVVEHRVLRTPRQQHRRPHAPEPLGHLGDRASRTDVPGSAECRRRSRRSQHRDRRSRVRSPERFAIGLRDPATRQPRRAFDEGRRAPAHEVENRRPRREADDRRRLAPLGNGDARVAQDHPGDLTTGPARPNPWRSPHPSRGPRRRAARTPASPSARITSSRSRTRSA